ncbi:MAG: YaaW family protein [Spirulinaceae cyanobacterium]
MVNELRDALELATDDERQQLTHILFCRRWNPLDYLQGQQETLVQGCDRTTQLDLIEQRFRFLAADGFTVLRGRSQALSYPAVLLRICRFLKLPHHPEMAVAELEAEIFLNLMGRAWHQLPQAEQRSLTQRIQRALRRSNFAKPLPGALLHNPVPFMLKGSGVLALTTVVRSLVLRQIAQQFTLHLAGYQAAKAAMTGGGAIAATHLQKQVALYSARRGLAVAAARQGAVRTVFAVLGPLLWTSLAVDLGWRAIATNYGRIIPAVFMLAQIRLTRTEVWAEAS